MIENDMLRPMTKLEDIKTNAITAEEARRLAINKRNERLNKVFEEVIFPAIYNAVSEGFMSTELKLTPDITNPGVAERLEEFGYYMLHNIQEDMVTIKWDKED